MILCTAVTAATAAFATPASISPPTHTHKEYGNTHIFMSTHLLTDAQLVCERDVSLTGPADLRVGERLGTPRERDNRISPAAFLLITTDLGTE